MMTLEDSQRRAEEFNSREELRISHNNEDIAAMKRTNGFLEKLESLESRIAKLERLNHVSMPIVVKERQEREKNGE